MAGFLLEMSAEIKCPHAASAKLAATGARLRVTGKPAALAGDVAAVAGCPFQVPVGTGTKPQPCVTVQWPKPAMRVRSAGKAVLIHPSLSKAESAEGIVQGPGNVVRQQTRVRGA
jgi:hypothetical protein